jgi:hypothetical protein
VEVIGSNPIAPTTLIQTHLAVTEVTDRRVEAIAHVRRLHSTYFYPSSKSLYESSQLSAFDADRDDHLAISGLMAFRVVTEQSA